MKDMRQSPRVEINHIASCTCHDGNDNYLPAFDSVLINLSTNGALIESKSPLKRKLLVLGNKSRTNSRLVKGEIVYTDTIITAEGAVFGMYRSGIKFTDLYENAKEFVVSIIMPGTSTGTTAEITTHKPQNGVTLDFDGKTINQILDDNTPTEDLLRLDDLFEDDGQDGMEYDVLESIAEVIEELNATEFEIPKIMGQSNEQHMRTQNQTASLPQKRPSVLLYFNSLCFVTLCFIATVALLFHTTEYCSSLITNKTIEIPFVSKTETIFPDDLQTLSPDKPKELSLVHSSIKGRFVKNN